MSTDSPESLDGALPSADEVAAYRERGWHVTGEIVPHALLDRMRALVEEHQHRAPDRRLPSEIGHADWSPSDGGGVRNSEFLSLQEPRARELSLMPLIGAIAAQLAGSTTIRLFDDQAVYKPPDDGTSVVGWHTDHSYWSTCTSTSMLTAWIPFEDSSIENGTIMVVDGSHLWQESEHIRLFNEPDLTRLTEHMGRPVPESAIIPLELRKGQVSFHHMRSVHASAANRTSAPRLADAVHLQDGANAYRPAFDTAANPIVLPHDRLCRRTPDGRPDYADPDVFPVLWSTTRDD